MVAMAAAISSHCVLFTPKFFTTDVTSTEINPHDISNGKRYRHSTASAIEISSQTLSTGRIRYQLPRGASFNNCFNNSKHTSLLPALWRHRFAGRLSSLCFFDPRFCAAGGALSLFDDRRVLTSSTMFRKERTGSVAFCVVGGTLCGSRFCKIWCGQPGAISCHNDR